MQARHKVLSRSTLGVWLECLICMYAHIADCPGPQQKQFTLSSVRGAPLKGSHPRAAPFHDRCQQCALDRRHCLRTLRHLSEQHALAVRSQNAALSRRPQPPRQTLVGFCGSACHLSHAQSKTQDIARIVPRTSALQFAQGSEAFQDRASYHKGCVLYEVQGNDSLRVPKTARGLPHFI